MAISITEIALNRLELLKKKRQTPSAVLRVGVRGGGCCIDSVLASANSSGASRYYNLCIVTEINSGDCTG